MLCGFLAWVPWITATTGAETREIPNLVVILVDDLRWDELGCTGHPFAATPNIDRIAREGILFGNAFCTTPLCSPVRASLLTGLYTHRHGILDNINRSEQSHRLLTFPRVLHDEAGYETAYVGKWHMGNDDTARPGFDFWVSMKGQGTSFDPVLNENGRQVPHRGHTTDVLNRRAADFIRSAAKTDRPFCLYLAHKALHPELVQRDDGSISDPSAAKFLPAKRHQKLYAGAVIPRRPNVDDDLAGKPALRRPIAGLPPLSRATGTPDETVRDRQRMLAGVDEGVGMLYQALKESGALADTVIVFTSDHGYWYGEHGLSVERRLAYEEGIRVPLLVRYPRAIGNRAGQSVDAMALSIDLAPTLLELGGLDEGRIAELNLDGRSLAPFLRGDPPENWRSSFLIEYNTDTVFPRVHRMGYRALRTERWKLIHYLELEGMDELYDLRKDPCELENRIGDASLRETLEKLRAELRSLQEGQ
jgi:N-acetylglucosamine-6-sulfatase